MAVLQVKQRKGGGHTYALLLIPGKEGKLVCLLANQNDMVCFAIYDKKILMLSCGMAKQVTLLKERYNTYSFSNVSHYCCNKP